ncbi:GDP-6-deoxy-D-mannose reductase [bacterium HR24]|nr:GDP-6-deoxy-D-mannose reductase [bacterium HR24]
MADDVYGGKRVLITGISGFVGPYLAQTLVALGAQVWGLSRHPYADRQHDSDRWHKKKGELLRGVRLVQGDVLDLSGLMRVLDEVGPDYVFHLASRSFVGSSFEQPIECLMTNVLGTVNLLECLRLSRARARLLVAGSSEEYGRVALAEGDRQWLTPAPLRVPELPIDEDVPLRPVSPYAASKVMAEWLGHIYARSYGLQVVVSRAFNHEGMGRGPQFVTSSIARQVAAVARGERAVVELGNVVSFRDWSHVRDIVEGYVLLAARGEAGRPYNLGSERTNSVLTYLLLALEAAGMRVRRVHGLGLEGVDDPLARSPSSPFKGRADLTRIDAHLLALHLNGDAMLSAGELVVETRAGPVLVRTMQAGRTRPVDVPVLLSDCRRARSLGFEPRRSLREVVLDQLGEHLSAPE